MEVCYMKHLFALFIGTLALNVAFAEEDIETPALPPEEVSVFSSEEVTAALDCGEDCEDCKECEENSSAS